MKPEICIENFDPSAVDIQRMEEQGESVLRVVKNERLYEFDTNSFARLQGVDFQYGTIMLKVKSRLLPDADLRYPGAYAGLVFWIQPENRQFEGFYIRPGAGRSAPADFRNKACQYFAYPDYIFSWFRDHKIEGFETCADIDLDEWIQLKAQLQKDSLKFYVNDMKNPVLEYDHSFYGPHEGGIGLFVDIGAEAFFKDLELFPDAIL